LVDQNPKIANRQDALLRDGETPAPALAATAAGLEAAGCDFIVMPCNAAHAYEDEIKAALRVPFVSIIDATCDALPDGVTRVGLMMTPACAKAGMYQAALDERGVVCIEHEADEFEQLMTLTYAIKRGDRGQAIADAMASLATGLIERGAQALIVACTEIPLVLQPESLHVPVVSSTEELARRTVLLAQRVAPLPIA